MAFSVLSLSNVKRKFEEIENDPNVVDTVQGNRSVDPLSRINPMKFSPYEFTTQSLRDKAKVYAERGELSKACGTTELVLKSGLSNIDDLTRGARLNFLSGNFERCVQLGEAAMFLGATSPGVLRVAQVAYQQLAQKNLDDSFFSRKIL